MDSGSVDFLTRKENESFPLIQRLFILLVFKLTGTVNVKFFYVYSLIFTIGIGILFSKVFIRNNISSIFLYPIFISIFSIMNYFVLWIGANYFLSTFFFTFLIFYLLVYKPRQELWLYLCLFVVPYGIVNGLITIVIAFFYLLYKKRFKTALVTILILGFQLLVFFVLTYQGNRSSFIENIVYCIIHLDSFFITVFSILGSFSRIVDSNPVLFPSIAGFITILFLSFSIYKIFKMNSEIVEWITLALLFLISSTAFVTIQRLPSKSEQDVALTPWYWFFSYLLLCLLLLILGKLKSLGMIKIKSFWLILPFLLLHFLQIFRIGFPQLLQIKAEGDTNQYNYIHNFKVDEDDEVRSTSNSLKFLTNMGYYSFKETPLDRLVKPKYDYQYENYSDFKAEKSNYNDDKSYFISIRNLRSVPFDKTFLYLIDKKGRAKAVNPIFTSKSMISFLKAPLNILNLHNTVKFNLSKDEFENTDLKKYLLIDNKIYVIDIDSTLLQQD